MWESRLNKRRTKEVEKLKSTKTLCCDDMGTFCQPFKLVAATTAVTQQQQQQQQKQNISKIRTIKRQNI